VEPILLANKALQLPVWFPLEGRVGEGEIIPRSRSSSSSRLAAIGRAEDDEVLTVSAA
jgi:hypothetical protein